MQGMVSSTRSSVCGKRLGGLGGTDDEEVLADERSPEEFADLRVREEEGLDGFIFP